jgi:hypothetical protein
MYPIYPERAFTIPALVLVVFAFDSGVGIAVLFQVCR